MGNKLDDEIQLVGWWNKDMENPEFTFSPPTEDAEKWSLVTLTVKLIPEQKDKFKSELDKLKRKGRVLDRTTKQILKASKKWSKIL